MQEKQELSFAQLGEYFYDCLIGQVLPEYSIPWVENLFEPGKPCYESYQSALDAYARLRQRLGTEPEDSDVEQLIDQLLQYSRIVGVQMFDYGRKYHMLLENNSNSTV